MDPNTPLPQVGNVPTEVNPPAPITPVGVPNPVPVEPITPPPATDQPPAPITPPPPTNQPTEPVKKSSPVFTIALTLLLVTILVLGGYMLWTKYLNPSNTKVTLTPIAVVTASPVSDPTLGWKTFTIDLANFTFKHPSNTSASEVVLNSVGELTGDKKYMVGYDASDVTPIQITLFKSTKDPGEWWSSEGQKKYDAFADSWKTNNPPIDVNLTYQTSAVTVAGKNGTKVIISADNPVTHLPEVNNLIILQNNGYIITSSYYEQQEGSIVLSEQILSTFKFIEATPAASPASSPSATARP